jgi:hypothetical protein
MNENHEIAGPFEAEAPFEIQIQSWISIAKFFNLRVPHPNGCQTVASLKSILAVSSKIHVKLRAALVVTSA